ncbi:MAG TPA: glycerophosphodiester phosphodiesterase [Candidatus Limnocylindrales bacterium]|nr:glycerophosphodiester phosphodiesterase [Candidatus Limnocylindrales bacterium]
MTTPGPARMLRLAHRGDWRVAPENSLEALEAAMRVPGCDGVEFDVRLSRDGVPVLLHDDTLRRVHGAAGRVDDLDAPKLALHGIPRLDDVLATLPGAWMDIELKGDDHGDATASVLRAARGDAPVNAVISSFEPPTLAAMGERLPGWSRWLNADDLSPLTLSLAIGLGCRGVSVLWGAITPAAVARGRAAGMDVAAWTVRRRATFERLARLGVVACCVEDAALDG